ncbi:hypothetical protein K488DRAFT_74812 [Vararia minispora EC-137]|uniref:Uncharacterized protein n=1 Tax=Vararia minispora EC-137 TaxID=1314806 RepID=A0ACB8Q5Z7_9AGAM|nr:hypothetical protein K488DRAFT_74812 [Vararia minispora EC-137]
MTTIDAEPALQTTGAILPSPTAVAPASTDAVSGTGGDGPFASLPDEFLVVLQDTGVDQRAVFGHEFLAGLPVDGERLLLQYTHFHAHHVRDRKTLNDCLLCVAIRFNQETVVAVIGESHAELCAEVEQLKTERDAARGRMLELRTEAAHQTALVGSLHDEAAALRARVTELTAQNASLTTDLRAFMEPGGDRTTALSLAALKEVIENTISQPPSLTQWNAKICAEYFRSLWAQDQRPMGVLIYPYWPEAGSSPLNLWVDAATVRGYLLFERTVPRARNPLLFAMALLVGLEPVKYYAYVNSNAQRWVIGEKFWGIHDPVLILLVSGSI